MLARAGDIFQRWRSSPQRIQPPRTRIGFLCRDHLGGTLTQVVYAVVACDKVLFQVVVNVTHVARRRARFRHWQWLFRCAVHDDTAAPHRGVDGGGEVGGEVLCAAQQKYGKQKAARRPRRRARPRARDGRATVKPKTSLRKANQKTNGSGSETLFLVDDVTT